MKIHEGLKHLGKPFEIPACGRNDLPEFFKEMGHKVGAEIGVFLGEYSEVIAKSGLKLFSIDPWGIYDDFGNPSEIKKINRQYETAKKRLSPYPNATIVRKTSMDALADFPDNSLDFVYIDANHHFRYIAEDIYEWSRKVRQGGIICGHDYAPFTHRYVGGGCQVKEVIDAFAKAYDLNFWVLGTYRKKKGETRDRFRSWLFVKTWENQ